MLDVIEYSVNRDLVSSRDSRDPADMESGDRRPPKPGAVPCPIVRH